MINILALSDEESPRFWNEFEPLRLDHIDMILACGDLSPSYLSFIATYTHAPVLYVHGNHDGRYEMHPPEGCICVEDQIYVCNGLRILGLGGSMQYNHGAHQYTQAQMKRRVQKLWFALRKHRGFDILMTHAPAYGIGDGTDLPHQGFEAFRTLLEKYQPYAMVHGHIHLNYGMQYQRLTQYQNTKIINAYEHYLLSVPTHVAGRQEGTRK